MLVIIGMVLVAIGLPCKIGELDTSESLPYLCCKLCCTTAGLALAGGGVFTLA